MLHQLGSGVLGPVFRAHDPRDGRLLAIKTFTLDLIPEDAERLARALERVARAWPAHPALAPILLTGLQGARPWVATSFLDGETLDVAARGAGALPAATALAVLAPVAEALDAAWAAGLGHGALHPRDVFVGPGFSRPRVTGAGIAGALEAADVKPPVRRPYAAPERVAGAAWDARADVYALGAIAHELLTGRRPVGPGEQRGGFAAGTGPARTRRLRDVLAAAMAADPDARFDTCGAFVEALQHAADGGQMALPMAEAPAAAPPAADPEPVAAPPDAPEWAVPIAAETTDAVLSGFPDEVAAAPPEAAPVDRPPKPVDEDPAGVWPVWPDPAPDDTTASALPPAAAAPTRPRSTWRGVAAMVVIGLTAGALSVALFQRDAGDRALSPEPPAATDTEVDLADDPPVTSGEPGGPPAPAAAPRTPAAPPAPPPEVARGSDPAVQRAADVAGQLLVRSEPSGAMVLVDGQLRGETPATVRDLPLGAHDVQVARPGYAPETRRVTLTRDAPARNLTVALTAALDPAAELPGAIYADSRPRGARVFVDGRLIGTTPLRLPDVVAGRHEVRLELEGYRTVTTPVAVSGGREARVAVTLTRRAPAAGGR